MKKQEREAFLEEKLKAMEEFENELYGQGARYVAGVDEVGRGPLAGPVVAAAVVLPKNFDLLGVDDSKKLSVKKREELAPKITEQALAYGISFVSNEIIDKVNILEATKLAMKDAVMQAETMLGERRGDKIDHILFDAMTIDSIDTPQTSIIKGDARSVSIAAASILAKVARDRLMCEYHEEYPAYAFDHNKGYGTAAHYAGLREAGICPLHRKSFLKKLQL